MRHSLSVCHIKSGQANPAELIVRGCRAAEESNFRRYANTTAGYNITTQHLTECAGGGIARIIQIFLLPTMHPL